MVEPYATGHTSFAVINTAMNETNQHIYDTLVDILTRDNRRRAAWPMKSALALIQMLKARKDGQ